MGANAVSQGGAPSSSYDARPARGRRDASTHVYITRRGLSRWPRATWQIRPKHLPKAAQEPRSLGQNARFRALAATLDLCSSATQAMDEPHGDPSSVTQFCFTHARPDDTVRSNWCHDSLVAYCCGKPARRLRETSLLLRRETNASICDDMHVANRHRKFVRRTEHSQHRSNAGSC